MKIVSDNITLKKGNFELRDISFLLGDDEKLNG